MEISQILSRLSIAVNGTDTDFYSYSQRLDFAEACAYKFTLDSSNDDIADEFVNFWRHTSHSCRRCSICGNLMCEGYVLDMGAAYYCSDECLHHDFTLPEWRAECESNDQSYYTEWY